MRENDRIVLANTEGRRQTAVFLTTGVVSECNLVTPAYFGNTTTYMGRRICIYPFHTEYQRAVAYIGNTLKHRQSYLGPLFNGTLSFSTRKDVGSGSSVTSPGTPMRPGRSALQFRRQGNHGSNHPGSLGFNEKGMAPLLLLSYAITYFIYPVPIYDVRGSADFMFTSRNMEELAHLPLYEGGTSDVPADALVTVGYAVNEYSANQGATASLNVLFVILIGDIDRDYLDQLYVAMMDADVDD